MGRTFFFGRFVVAILVPTAVLVRVRVGVRLRARVGLGLGRVGSLPHLEFHVAIGRLSVFALVAVVALGIRADAHERFQRRHAWAWRQAWRG